MMPLVAVYAPRAFANSQPSLRMDLLLVLDSLGKYRRPSKGWSLQMTRIKWSHKKRKTEPGSLVRTIQTLALTMTASMKVQTGRRPVYFHKDLKKPRTLMPIQKYQTT